MYNEKQILDFFNSFQKKLKERFETRYGFTDRKRTIDNLINEFPNGLEILLFNIEEIKDADSSMVIKYNPNNLENPLKYHGFYKVAKIKEVEKIVKETYKIKWDMKIKKNLLSTTCSDQNGYYFYLKNEVPLIETISSFYEFYLNNEINRILHLCVEGIDDQIHSIELKEIWENYKKIIKLPKNKSFIIFDLPFILKLEKDRYNFLYKKKKGELRICTLRAHLGDGRPPISLNIWGGINITRVIILYPFNKNDDKDKIIITAVHIMNEIIESYRVVTNYYFIPNISLTDIKEYSIFIVGKGGTSGIRIQDSFSPYFKYDTEIKKEEYSPIFEKYLSGKENIPLHKKLLLNSKRHFYNQNYQYSIFELILALEIVTLNFLEKNYNRLNIKRGNINEFFIRTGIMNTIKYVIPLLVLEQNKEKLIELIPSCINVIKIRNKIAHKGIKTFETEIVANYIKTIERAIEIIENN